MDSNSESVGDLPAVHQPGVGLQQMHRREDDRATADTDSSVGPDGAALKRDPVQMVIRVDRHSQRVTSGHRALGFSAAFALAG